MADFYLDENVSAITAGRLIRLGHTIVPATRLLPAGSDDHLQFAMAVRQRRVLVTANAKDFKLLHLAWQAWFAEWGTPPLPLHAGILIFGQPPTLPAEDCADQIHAFATPFGSAEGLANRYFEWRAYEAWREIV